jgi:hypothetical protein
MTDKALETMSLAELVAAKVATKNELAAHRTAAAARDAELVSRIRSIQLAMNLHDRGLDAAKIAAGKAILEIRGTLARAGDAGPSIIEDAMAEVTAGGGRLKSEYFGSKAFQGFHGQRENHLYGYGPQHGFIVFKVGLSHDARIRNLNAEEIDAALYYLVNLDRVQAAEPTEV